MSTLSIFSSLHLGLKYVSRARWGLPAFVAFGSLIGACVLFPDASDLVSLHAEQDGGLSGDGSMSRGDVHIPDGASADAACVAPALDPTALSNVLHIAVGNGFACAVRTTNDVVCWGQSYRGQFGVTPDGGIGNSNVDRSAKPVIVPGLTKIVQITAGDSHACALDSDGHVWCWGLNSQGQLGNGSVSPSRGGAYTSDGQVIDWDPKPALVLSKSGGLLERVMAISGGLNHSCALVQGGVVACWGSNYAGQLGEPGGVDSQNQDLIETQAVPNAIALGGAINVAAGNGCSCAAIGGSTPGIECAGSNQSSQLGVDPPDSGVPVAMPLPSSANKPRNVVASFYQSSHTLVLDSAGNVFGVGDNSLGSLGAFSSSLPVAVPGLSSSNVAYVATGPTHTCAILTDGTLACIGANIAGELGRGFDSDHENNPASVEAPLSPDHPEVDAGDGTQLTNVTEVAVGFIQSCALVKNACRTDGTVYCWGGNYIGQLGDGTFTFHARPVRVIAP